MIRIVALSGKSGNWVKSGDSKTVRGKSRESIKLVNVIVFILVLGTSYKLLT